MEVFESVRGAEPRTESTAGAATPVSTTPRDGAEASSSSRPGGQGSFALVFTFVAAGTDGESSTSPTATSVAADVDEEGYDGDDEMDSPSMHWPAISVREYLQARGLPLGEMPRRTRRRTLADVVPRESVTRRLELPDVRDEGEREGEGGEEWRGIFEAFEDLLRRLRGVSVEGSGEGEADVGELGVEGGGVEMEGAYEEMREVGDEEYLHQIRSRFHMYGRE